MNVTMNLVTIERKDLDKLRHWRNDYAIWRWTRQSDLLNEVEHAQWFERQAVDPTIRMYGVEISTREGRELVGVCGLTSIDYRNSRAEFSLYIAPTFQRHGFGEKALRLLFAHGFANLGLNSIYGETFDGNPATALFERLGMQREGTRREFYWRDGQFIDAHLFSLTRRQWIASQQPSPPAPTSPSSRSPLSAA